MEDCLVVHSLGRLSIHIDDQPVTGLVSRKAAALLVYLVANPHPHAREVMADMLWDNRTQSRAMANLRVVLSSLRKELGEYINITREQVTIDKEANTWLDILQFEQNVDFILQHKETLSPEELEQAAQRITLYKGEFLEGVYLRACRRMEDWVEHERERLHHKAVSALSSLVTHALHNGDYRLGVEHVQRLLELDPLMESGHRQMMRLLSLSGQRGAALAQFQTCRSVLQDELGVQPEAATVDLYEQIRQGQLTAPREALPLPAPRFPAFLEEQAKKKPHPPFVGRKTELDRLDEFLERALSGKGKVVFVAGDAGSGKTSLLRGFARHVQNNYPQVLLAMGECNAFSGLGDPYLPFRELLRMLTGDLESRLSADDIGREQAHFLWSALPVTLSTLLEHGRGLLTGFISASALAARLRLAAPANERWEGVGYVNWMSRPTHRHTHRNSPTFPTSSRGWLTKHAPLISILDDLQWADAGSISLLFHLARYLEYNPLLILAAYRPEEIGPDRSGVPNPLEKLLHEFNRRFEDSWIDLNTSREARSRQFVSDLLDLESNNYTPEFRQALFRHTGGHPLFTVELLRVLQEQGGLEKDEHGVWRESPQLSWEVIPPVVEGVIEARLARLDLELQNLLRLACLMGEQFSLHVLARLTEKDEASLAHLLGEQLSRRNHLVRESGARQIGSQRDYLFRFRHALFQQHLYHQVGEAERRLLHGQIGQILETLYTGSTEEITVQLARHYSEAGEADKAVKYLLITLGPDMETLPEVAASWEITHAGSRYIFHLRDDVVWSDGIPVTAADFEFAWKRMLDPAMKSPAAIILYDIKGAQAFHQGQITDPDLIGVQCLDDHTLVVDLEGPAGYFLYLLANSVTYPVPRHVIEMHADRWTEVELIVTNGPYKLMSWKRGLSISLARNPLFHGQFKGNLQQIEFLVGLEPSRSLTLYEQDKLDMALLWGTVMHKETAHAAANPLYAKDFVSWPVFTTEYMRFDTSRPPFNDRRVRRAFVMAIDRDWWANEIKGGWHTPATGGFIPPGIPGHSPGIGLPYDPVRARQLLAQASYPNGDGFPPITQVRPIPQSEWYLRLELLPQRWQTVLGVEVADEVMRWNAYVGRLRAQTPHIFYMGWEADYPDPDNFLRLGISSNNMGIWPNKSYVRLVEQARRILNQEKRMDLYQKADRILIEDAAILPLTYMRYHMLKKPWVKKYPLSPQKSSYWKDVIIEPH